MITIIAGSQTIEDAGAVARAMSLAADSGIRPTAVITGRARRGVDPLGEAWAKARGIPVIPMPADWDRAIVRRAAGPNRNRAMSKLAQALVAIWDGHSPGTKDMIDSATAAGLLVRVLRLDAEQPELF